MAPKLGSVKESFAERGKERLLPGKGYSELGSGSSDGDGDDGVKCCSFRIFSDKITSFFNGFRETAVKVYEMGRSDPRKVFFAAKMGFSLALISLVIFLKEPLENVNSYSVWSVLTVVVVFEFSLDFATWEPPHGPYRTFKYPWKNYVKVSGALRHCAFMVMAMHGSILSEIQAPAEKRRVFSSELQRVGTAGAKVIREIGSKVEKMEKLHTGDILAEVHVAAEQLQMKIDEKSYLLVNFESWEAGKRPKEFEDQDVISHHENNHSVITSLNNESFLNVGTEAMAVSCDPNSRTSFLSIDPMATGLVSSESMFNKAKWPSRLSLAVDFAINEQEAKTYESASSLSLATFASLLIEFVARLQNLVDAFEELSEKAQFKDANNQGEGEDTGFWRKLITCFRSKN
ncbi:hypothetical protein Ancab_021034 [Ancistrocladus abbreviatus]